MAGETNIRVLTPRVRRALEGASPEMVLTDDQIRDVIADACSDVILYTGSLFGGHLVVLETDPDTSYPAEYGTTQPLTLAQQSVIAAQAALTHFFFMFAGLKVQERIADEASSWEYQLSANLLVQQLKFLQGERDKALSALEDFDGTIERYASFLQERDHLTARRVEPWAEAQGVCLER